jgi:RNA polymerase sigma-70 factor (ECF subfamily)
VTDAVHRELKAAHPRALAALIRLLGGFEAAEDALHDAVTRALEVWPVRGVPDHPAAWLVTTARRRHIDLVRRRHLEERYAEGQPHATIDDESGPERQMGRRLYDDDMMRLIFTCCHPALGMDARVALTLRAIAGLTVEEIARAFLVPPRTIEQRIVRARRKIRQAGIPYEIPGADDLPARRTTVMAVVYLVFNEGYAALAGPALVRVDLCTEAIRLGRELVRLFRSDTEVMGLLALMLLQHARHRARTDGGGGFVSLDRQDRSLWDAGMITEGRALVEKALRHGRPGPYQVQAAIAALHCEAAASAETDWPQIVQLYETLEVMQPSPVVHLNRAVAVWKAHGAAAGLALLDDVRDAPAMQRYPYYHAARAALCAELSRLDEARSGYREALRHTRHPAERAHLKKKLTEL